MAKRSYVVLMGGLHIEIALLNVLVDWLDGSGWISIMATANVTTKCSPEWFAHVKITVGSSSDSSSFILSTESSIYSIQRWFWKSSLLMSGLSTWKPISHNSILEQNSQIRDSPPPVYAITTRRKLLDVCGSTVHHHTMDRFHCAR